ncbi:MAG TPA: IS21 family transposase [Micromonosporaceae bacterium]|nr:IS21 family transposase [Micromonosporaceae bacterium]
MLSVEDWAEIRRLHRSERMSIKAIARVMGVARNTVRAALASDGPPKYTRPAKGSIVDAVEPQIRELLQAFPAMPATVIAERIGWTRSVRVLSGRVAQLRPLYVPPDPSSRTSYAAGEIAQCDFWFPPIRLPVGFGQTRTAKQLPVLTMVCGHSRWLSALLVPSRHAEDLFAGWWRLLDRLGAVPRVLVWDGEAAVGRWRGGRSELTVECQAFRGTLGAKVLILRPADPEAKGIIERAHDYLERSFLPGRTFVSPADFNTQLGEWLATVANLRIRRVLGCAAADRITADRAAMLTLPPVAPTVGWRTSTRLGRDHYIRLDSNDYSVHPQVIGRRIEIAADLDRVRVFCDGRSVADHQRVWARHQTLSDPDHVAAARALRTARMGVLRPVPEPEVELRCLADYDTALGIDDLDGADRINADGVDRAEGGVA